MIASLLGTQRGTDNDSFFFMSLSILIHDDSRDFGPKHIFFRSVDTGRLLTMDNAGFRVQVWRRSQCDRDAEDKAEFMVFGMVHNFPKPRDTFHIH